MELLYADADCLLFPSKLETWGLPISEAKAAGLPLIVADLPYARESAGTYDRVVFVPVDDRDALAAAMLATTSGANPFLPVSRPPPAAPFAADWPTLIRQLTIGL